MEEIRFSDKIREDIIKSPPKNSDECQYELASALLCARVSSHGDARHHSKSTVFSPHVSEYLRTLMVCCGLYSSSEPHDIDLLRRHIEGRGRIQGVVSTIWMRTSVRGFASFRICNPLRNQMFLHPTCWLEEPRCEGRFWLRVMPVTRFQIIA